MSNVHDHLWIDIFQHTRLVEQDEKRIWRYRHHLIFYACDHGSTRALNAIIASGGDVNMVDNNGRAPLWIASLYSQVKVVKILLAAGADVNIPDKNGRTPLVVACSWANSVNVVKMLLAAGADVNTCIYGQTPLSVSNNKKIRKMLLEAGAIE